MTGAVVEHDRTLIDYLTITHDNRAHLAHCLRGPVQRVRYAMKRYQSTYEDGHGTTLSSGGPEPRPHMLIMSGKPLAAWRAELSVRDLFVHLTEQDVHCTRLDLTRDTSGHWTPYLLRRLTEEDRYVSLWKRVFYQNLKSSGQTVVCGSRQSDFMLRCYDKKAQLERAKTPCPLDRLSRWELQLGGDLSSIALYRLAQLALRLDEETGAEDWPLRTFHSAWLGRHLRMTVEPVNRVSNNQSKAATRPDWDEFLADAADDILVPELDERTPAQQAFEVGQWAVRTLAPTLALIDDLGGIDLVRALIERGRDRPSAKRDLLRSRIEQTLPALASAIQRPHC